VFQRALLIDPNLILAHFLLAQTYYSSGLVKESIAAYTRVLELHPQHCEARFNLVEAMYQVG
jgi:Tfp pilus assembly protein PilF